ncbi:MAG: metallophosphoesterase family protein [Actinomycetota bacterium]
MRVAALYDIHGNLPALEAVLTEVEKLPVDRLVIGGDFIWGPFPSETIERLRALGERAIVIAGNSEREVVDRLDETEELPPHLVAPVRWTAERLDDDQLEFVARLPRTVAIDIEWLGPTLFCHATPRSDEEFITKATPDDVLVRVLEDVEQHVVVCGHTHMQYDRKSPVRVVNPGSVGMPYEREPGAYWALLGPGVTLRRTIYDVGATVEKIRATGFPFDRLADTLESPPRQEDILEAFEEARRTAGEAGRDGHTH